jgi:hypothetical protein
MIDISIEGKVIKVFIDSGISVKENQYVFKHECRCEADALIIRHHLAGMVENEIECARRKAYNQGWDDAKKKRKKEKFFSCRL